MNYSDAHPLIHFITHNEEWDIRRSEDNDFVTFHLHGTRSINYKDLRTVSEYLAFSGITMDQDGLGIHILKSEL